MLIKLECIGYRMVKKNYDNILCRFHLIRYRNVTDGQTDRFAISITRVSMLTRDKHHGLTKAQAESLEALYI